MTLCSSCRRNVLTRISLRAPKPQNLSSRPFSSTSTTCSAAPTAIPSSNPGLSQPLSTPHAPNDPSIPTPKSTAPAKAPKALSSILGGTELKGLGYTKAKPQILAKEDHAYPAWLWTLLDEKKSATGEVKVDLNAMTKRQRAKYDRKQERLTKNLPKSIPVHEQSKDLTGPDATAQESLAKRQEITKSSRVARRKSIREDNFLRSM